MKLLVEAMLESKALETRLETRDRANREDEALPRPRLELEREVLLEVAHLRGARDRDERATRAVAARRRDRVDDRLRIELEVEAGRAKVEVVERESEVDELEAWLKAGAVS